MLFRLIAEETQEVVGQRDAFESRHTLGGFHEKTRLGAVYGLLIDVFRLQFCVGSSLRSRSCPI